MNAAMDQALAHIGDAFRPERKEHLARIGTACQIKAMVQSHRYTFPQALEKMEARTDWMLESFEWMAIDNVALNITHDTEIHAMADYQLNAWEWLKRITAAEQVAA